MKSILVFSFSLVCFCCKAQNEAYNLSEGGMDLKRVDLESNKIMDYYSFLDTLVLKITPSDNLPVFTEQNDFLHLDSSQIMVCFVPRGFPSSNSPYFKAINDSVNVNDKWYKIQIIRTDDHFVGGSPNTVTTDITVQDLGIIYSSYNWVNAHTDIMICHQDSLKQVLLTTAFEYIEMKHPLIVEETRIARIISLTKEYNFNNLVYILSDRWLAPRKDLKLISTHTETINGQIQYSVVVKNISDRGYYFVWGSEFGPGMIEHTINDERITSRIDGDYHGTQYHYNFEKKNESIYLNPGQELSLNLKPNWRENCGACDQNKYFGLQVYRYGVDFFYWIFSDEVEHNGFYYTLYHLQEIK